MGGWAPRRASACSLATTIRGESPPYPSALHPPRAPTILTNARNVSEPLAGTVQTNQRAELTAILRALEITPSHQPVRIVTDSQYSINCATVWAQSWERKGWKTASGEDVKNQDLVRGIRERVKEREAQGAATAFEWVKGHAMNPGNEAADRLAVAGANTHVV